MYKKWRKKSTSNQVVSDRLRTTQSALANRSSSMYGGPSTGLTHAAPQKRVFDRKVDPRYLGSPMLPPKPPWSNRRKYRADDGIRRSHQNAIDTCNFATVTLYLMLGHRSLLSPKAFLVNPLDPGNHPNPSWFKSIPDRPEIF